MNSLLEFDNATLTAVGRVAKIYILINYWWWSCQWSKEGKEYFTTFGKPNFRILILLSPHFFDSPKCISVQCQWKYRTVTWIMLLTLKIWNWDNYDMIWWRWWWTILNNIACKSCMSALIPSCYWWQWCCYRMTTDDDENKKVRIYLSNQEMVECIGSYQAYNNPWHLQDHQPTNL